MTAELKESLSMKMKLKAEGVRVGAYIKIYQKPITHEDYEGIGRIKNMRLGADGELMLEVSFRDEAGPFTRFVYPPFEVCRGWN